MLTNQHLHNAYVHSGLISDVDDNWIYLHQDEIWIRIEELIKSLCIFQVAPESMPLSSELSTLHKYWLTQSTSYERLCKQLTLHDVNHSSNEVNVNPPISIEEKTKEIAREAAQQLACYVEKFGPIEITRIKYWPIAEMLMSRYSFDIAELNEWLSGLQQRVFVA